MRVQSLRVRLLLGAAAAIFAALVASWFAMTLLFQRHIERRIADELRRDALQLVANLVIDPEGRPVTGRTPADSRFVEPAGGLYWQLSTPTGLLRSQSLVSERLPDSPEAAGSGWHRRVADGPFNQRILLIERVVRLDSRGVPVLAPVGKGHCCGPS